MRLKAFESDWIGAPPGPRETNGESPMAEPPNALTDLLGGKTPQDAYEALKREQCLAAAAIQHPDLVIALIRETDAAALQSQARGEVGGTPPYWIVIALLKASYLNDRARGLLAINTVDRKSDRAN